MQVALLGPLEVRSEKGPVGLSAPKQRAVVEMLALRPSRPVTAELLIAGLWGESPPASAAKVLQTYVSRLRRAIPEPCLMTSGNAYFAQPRTRLGGLAALRKGRTRSTSANRDG